MIQWISVQPKMGSAWPVQQYVSPRHISTLDLSYLVPLFPVYPKTTSCQETSHSLTSKMRNPTILTQLSHYCINPWESCVTLARHTIMGIVIFSVNSLSCMLLQKVSTHKYLFPSAKGFRVFLPRILTTQRIVNHFV